MKISIKLVALALIGFMSVPVFSMKKLPIQTLSLAEVSPELHIRQLVSNMYTLPGLLANSNVQAYMISHPHVVAEAIKDGIFAQEEIGESFYDALRAQNVDALRVLILALKDIEQPIKAMEFDINKPISMSEFMALPRVAKTPLARAVEAKFLPAVKLLLERGANANAVSETDLNALAASPETAPIARAIREKRTK